MSGRPRLHVRFQVREDLRSGGGGANALVAEVLRREFEVVAPAESADLQVCSFDWNAPATPPRLFLDHGSFADAAFWAYVVPKLRPGDTIVVTSRVCEQVAGRLLEPGGVRIVRVPLPVDLNRFRPAADRAAARRALAPSHDIPASGPLLLVVAAFVRRKNHHLAIDLMRTLLKERSDCHLAIAGSIPNTRSSRDYSEGIAALAREPGLEGRVRILGPQPVGAVAALMAGADLLVHLSTCRLENFGLVAAEAAASGLPVLAADWGGLRDVVRHEKTGWLAPTWLSDRGPRTDWSSLVDPALRLLEDPDAWSMASQAARRLAEAEFAPEVHAGRLRDAVEAAAAWASRPGGAVALTEAGQDLAFRTISLNARHPEIRDAGDEFRLLLPLERGRYVRLLIGPAATFERSPPLGPRDRPYALVRWRPSAEGIEILDPAWPATVPLDERGRARLRRCDGSTPLEAILGDGSDGMAWAQLLADDGVMGAWSASRA
jgi:glycosyltransferase involved in cell wall biosynthesis